MIKVSILLALGLVADAACRKQSAAFRHWVLTAAVLCGIAAPMLELIVPSWRLPIHPTWFTGTVEPVKLLIATAAGSSVGNPARLDAASGGQPQTWRVIDTIWLSGTIASFSALLAGLARLAWLASRARIVAEAKWRALASELSLRYRLRRPVRLLESPHPALLAACGIWKPTVILPPAARSWSGDRARIVLGHELAHIRRNDWLIHILAGCLRSFYWFNPLAWIICRRLRDASERACDDFVLGLGIQGHDYATHLVDLARTFRGHRAIVFPAPAMARPSSLERRVAAMLNTRVDRSPLSWTATVAVLLLLVGVTVPVASLVVSAQAGSATFSGTLIDAVGRMLPDTTVTLSNVGTEQRIDARSDQSGHFFFGGLPAGEYLLQVRKPGFATSQGRIALAAGQALTRDIALQIGVVMESVTVYSADTPAVPAPTATMPQPSDRQADLDRCAQTSIGGCITPPVKIADSRPVYPVTQRARGVGGVVVLEGRIGTDGLVKDLRALAPSDPDLASAAFDAVSRWRFTPTHLDGVPVETSMRVTANFVAQ